MNKNGYQELFSRIGNKFIHLPQASAADIKELCHVNAINDAEEIARIINECNGDLRRVDRNFLRRESMRMGHNMRGKINKAA